MLKNIYCLRVSVSCHPGSLKYTHVHNNIKIVLIYQNFLLKKNIFDNLKINIAIVKKLTIFAKLFIRNYKKLSYEKICIFK